MIKIILNFSSAWFFILLQSHFLLMKLVISLNITSKSFSLASDDLIFEIIELFLFNISCFPPKKSKVKTSTLIPLQALLMTKASADATARYYPNIRNHGVTRSGGLGIQKYAETWTGDNDTSWHSLKWSSSIGLGLSLSGIGLFGHDIGGFTGPKTSKDLMIRSLQLMLFHPRFHMNSWKPNAKKNSSKK